jgi:hypothetical protein
LYLRTRFNVRLGPDSHDLTADRLPLWFSDSSRIQPVEQRLFMNAEHAGDFAPGLPAYPRENRWQFWWQLEPNFGAQWCIFVHTMTLLERR